MFEEEARGARDLLEGAKKLESFMKQEGLKRGLNKEERAEMTLEGALNPPTPEGENQE